MNIEDQTIISSIVDSITHFVLQLKRKDLLPKIIQALRKQVAQEYNTSVVSSASELTSEEKNKLMRILRKKFGEATEVNFDLDSSLMGGYRVKIGDIVIDQSAKGQLQKMHETHL